MSDSPLDTLMQLWCERAGEAVLLDDEPIGRGGEAAIHAVADNEDLAAKVYHEPSAERAAKLEVMLQDPPANPPAPGDHVSIAWPVDRLLDDDRGVVGYLMPRLHHARSIHEFYNPAQRLRKCPLFHYGYLLRTARNLSAAIWALHERGYVVGDLNESNLLVTTRALVTFVDADSIQVRGPHGIFPCPVGRADYTPPELQDAVFADVERTPEHDAFAVGVLIFQLLMAGTHPYAGVHEGEGDPPGIAQRIAAGDWPYCRQKSVPFRPTPHAPPFETLPVSVQELMWSCFEEGHDHPDRRPDAAAWQRALHDAENHVLPCARNPQHWFHRGLDECPWCALAEQRGRDLFPPAGRRERRSHVEIESAAAPVVAATREVTAPRESAVTETPAVRTARRLPVAEPMERVEATPPGARIPLVELGQSLARASWRFAVAFLVIGLGAGLVWLFWPGASLERRYLPDDCHTIVFARPGQLLGTKAYQQLQGRTPALMGRLESWLTDRLGVSAGDIDRLTLALDRRGNLVAVVRTHDAVSFDAIEKTRRDAPGYSDLTYRTVPFGSYDLYEESYERAPGRRSVGMSFCVPEGRTVLVGKIDVLRAILERASEARLQPALARAVAETDFSRPLAWASTKVALLKHDIVDIDLDKIEAFSGSSAIAESMQARLLLFCADEAVANRLRHDIDLALPTWRSDLLLDPRVPPNLVHLFDAVTIIQRRAAVRIHIDADIDAVLQTIVALRDQQQPVGR